MAHHVDNATLRTPDNYTTTWDATNETPELSLGIPDLQVARLHNGGASAGQYEQLARATIRCRVS
ncbi:hypothetical protein GCM10009803_29300 [Microbacterium ginsengiterrae]